MPELDTLAAALRDGTVVELMVNQDGSMYVERSGAGLEKLPGQAKPEDVLAILKAFVGDPGVFGPSRPYADLLALDGSRVHVIAPPLVSGGLCLTVRKRPSKRPSLPQLAEGGALSHQCAGFLSYAIEHKKNILVVGGTSSGKTTLLNALIEMIDPKERLIILEDTPELTPTQPHVMSLRTRTRDAAGQPDVTLGDLLVNTLRMRPDRIIVGEVRGPEALALLQAMNVGHEGTLGTLHANSCREAIQRLETLVLMAGTEMPLKAVRGNIASALDLIVFMARLADGSRRVVQVAEVTGMELENLTMADLYKTESRKTAAGMTFQLRPTGSIPRFYDQLRQQGHEPPLDFFKSN